MRCAACKGVAHPATGCQYTEKTLICRNCTERVWKWVRQHTNGKGRRKGPNFYDHVKGPDDEQRQDADAGAAERRGVVPLVRV